MAKYDHIIVGAGPAGIFACLEILKKSPKAKIALIDMGNRLENRKPSEVMRGFGGAGTYSDGKLHYTPKLSHERAFHLISPEKYEAILVEIEHTFKKFGVNSGFYPKNEAEVQELIKEAEKEDIELIVRRAQHVGTDKLKNVITSLQKYLEEHHIKLITNTEIKDFIVKDNICHGVIDTKGQKTESKKVLLAPGRIGAKWLQDLSKKYAVKFQYGMVEVGVRVEFPESVMKHYADALYEIVLKVHTSTFDDTMRTFCSCPNGFVAQETYRGYVCVNGYSNSNHLGKNSNFAFLCEVHLTEPVENSIAYAKSIAELASTIGGGKPGDISMALPHRIVTNIIEGLKKLDSVMPGINSGSTLLYAPEVKFRSSQIVTDKALQTDVKNLYVAGDAAGLSGSITGAAATGILAAHGMLK